MACIYTTVYWGSSGFGPNTKGWNSQEKPSILPFHTPQVKPSHQSLCSDSQNKISDAPPRRYAQKLYKKNRFAARRKSQEVTSVMHFLTLADQMRVPPPPPPPCSLNYQQGVACVTVWGFLECTQVSTRGCCGRRAKRTCSIWRGSSCWRRGNSPCLTTTRRMWDPGMHVPLFPHSCWSQVLQAQ